MTIGGSLEPLGGLLQDNGVLGSLEAITGEFTGTLGELGVIAGDLPTLEGALTGGNNFTGTFSGELRALAGALLGPDVYAITAEPLGGELAGVMGAVGALDGDLLALSGSFAGATPITGSLAGSLQYMAGSLSGGMVHAGTVAGSLRGLRGSFAGYLGPVGAMSGELRPFAGEIVGFTQASGVVAVAMSPIRGAFVGGPAVPEEFRTWAVNTRSGGVTQYTAHPFNSYARYNGGYLAAGPDGLFLLAGDDDDGEAIAWSVVTGQHDDKKPWLKRLTEVLMGLRSTGPVKVRVWKDDNESYEYTLVNYREGVLHQARAKGGKGMRSRYYKVGVSGTGPALELDSMILNTPDTARKVG